MKYGQLWDLYHSMVMERKVPLTFRLFGVEYNVVTIGLFDHRKNLAEILLKSTDLDIQTQIDIPISFEDLHNWLSNYYDTH